jgi:hypothetical protein
MVRGHRPSSSDSAVVEDGGGPLTSQGFPPRKVHPELPPRPGTLTVKAYALGRTSDGDLVRGCVILLSPEPFLLLEGERLGKIRPKWTILACGLDSERL